MKQFIRQSAEQEYRHELEALQKNDSGPKPLGWKLSPHAVLDFLLGETEVAGVKISRKYIGPKENMELAIATLMSQQALLLSGIPGTAKTMVSELLAAAISGNSTMLVQGASGTTEEDLSYAWNYGLLLKDGPSLNALVPSPVLRAMRSGKIVRIEELTRIPQEIQDNLLTILSEKTMSLPELETEERAQKGFNLIATANEKDKGTHALSAAMQRRFNTVRLEVPKDIQTEVDIVLHRLRKQLDPQFALKAIDEKDIAQTVRIFRELRSGQTEEKDQKVQPLSSNLNTASIIACIENYSYLQTVFGQGEVLRHKARTLYASLVKEPSDDVALKEYMETVMRKRGAHLSLYEALKKLESNPT